MGATALYRRPETWNQGALHDRISLTHADAIAIIVAILGVDLALWRAMDSRYKDTRQDMAGLRQAIKETNARIDTLEGHLNAWIDALYQGLFSRKVPAA